MNSIWSSVECDAWSRNFTYEDYLHIQKQSGARALSRNAYAELCDVLETEMEKDIGEVPL